MQKKKQNKTKTGIKDEYAVMISVKDTNTRN